MSVNEDKEKKTMEKKSRVNSLDLNITRYLSKLEIVTNLQNKQ